MRRTTIILAATLFAIGMAQVGSADELECKRKTRGRYKNYCGGVHSTDPEGWLRGFAALDRSNGKVRLTFQIETDSTASAPKGRMAARFLDASGATVKTIKMGKDAYRGGKPPGKAAKSTYRMKTSIPVADAQRVDSITVDVEQTGKYTRVFNIKADVLLKALELALQIFDGGEDKK